MHGEKHEFAGNPTARDIYLDNTPLQDPQGNMSFPTPIALSWSAVGADSNPNVLEFCMKSEYRQAVESVIAQEMKLAEVTKFHADAAAREKQLSEALRFNQEALEQCECRVAELEPTNKGTEELQSQINASLKFLCRELMRPEA